MGKEAIVVFCAHSDDQILGVGGTMAQYAKEGKEVHTVIFSYGESSHPHLKKEVVQAMRKKESEDANKVIEGKDVRFFGLREGKFLEDQKNVTQRCKRIIQKYKPTKIFTHSFEDPHPDHRAVNKTITELLPSLDYKPEVYLFDVWNLWNVKTDYPKLYVDISKTFQTKIKALKCFPSQLFQMQLPLMWSVYLRAFLHGLKARCRYAERFFRIQ